jgi:hypothetical protein
MKLLGFLTSTQHPTRKTGKISAEAIAPTKASACSGKDTGKIIAIAPTKLNLTNVRRFRFEIGLPALLKDPL